MTLRSSQCTPREAAIIPLAAILLTVLMAALAFAVDLGWIVKSHTELQNAANVAALAGAVKLEAYYVNYFAGNSNTPAESSLVTSAISSCYSAAKAAANANMAGNTGSVAVASADVTIGYTDPSTYTYYAWGSSNYPTIPTGHAQAGSPQFPNTVDVKVYMDGGSGRNATLNLFFGMVIGESSATLNAEARAAILNATPTSIPDSYYVGAMLPITTDIQAWKNFVSTGVPTVSEPNPSGGYYYNVTFPTTTAPSSYSGNNLSGSNAVLGGPALVLYPDPMDGTALSGSASFKEPYVNLVNPPSNSASDLRYWWQYGPSPSDVTSLHNAQSNGIAQLDSNGMLPTAQTPSVSVDYGWKSQPGNRNGGVSLPDSGTVHLIPLYTHASPESVIAAGSSGSDYANVSGGGPTSTFSVGNGQDFWFNITGFVPVLIVQGADTGSGGTLAVQPTSMSLPSSSFPTSGASAPAPATAPVSGTSPSPYFAPPALTYPN